MQNKFAKMLEKTKTTIYRVRKETGVPQTTLWEWQHGEITPRVKTIKKVAEYFGVGIEDLIDD